MVGFEHRILQIIPAPVGYRALITTSGYGRGLGLELPVVCLALVERVSAEHGFVTSQYVTGMILTEEGIRAAVDEVGFVCLLEPGDSASAHYQLVWDTQRSLRPKPVEDRDPVELDA